MLMMMMFIGTETLVTQLYIVHDPCIPGNGFAESFACHVDQRSVLTWSYTGSAFDPRSQGCGFDPLSRQISIFCIYVRSACILDLSTLFF